MNWFLRFLEKIGRKKIFVDFYGNILAHRYYLFYYEEDEDKKKGIRWLPNVWLHYFPVEKYTDGGYEHNHPWATITYVLKGGYVETFNGKDYLRKKGEFIFRTKDDVHQLKACIPGSWTLFYHGFRKTEWQIHVKGCDDVCDKCKPYGKCLADNEKVEYSEVFTRFSDNENEDSWKGYKWLKCTDSKKLEAKLNRRRKALERLKMKYEEPDAVRKRLREKSKLFDYMMDKKTKY